MVMDFSGWKGFYELRLLFDSRKIALYTVAGKMLFFEALL